MKIEALRLAAFRRFADPAAIEDFGDGINVLSGPNEMGKSTFFHGLEAAFTVRHKVSGAVLDAMRPFAGGEPLVEADFTIAGQRWRIRKQFGRGSAAVLTDLTGGRVVARNAEAEDQLNALIGRHGETLGPIGLVWVRQQRALHAPDPDVDPLTGKEKQRGERSALQVAIGQEVEAAAGGEHVERVQHLVAAALDVYLTPTRNAARKNGPLDVARRQREEARAALELAMRAADAAEQRLKGIAAASAEIAALSDPVRAALRLQTVQRLDAEVATEVQRRSDLKTAQEALKARIAEAEVTRQALDGARARRERLAALEVQRVSAAALEASIAGLSAALNEDAATPARLDRLNTLLHVRDLANAELGGDATRVEIALEPQGAGRVRIGGVALAQSAQCDVPEHLDVAIDGIATIRVTAAGAERAAASRVKRDTAESEISGLLSAMGAATPEDARSRAEARSRAVESLDRSRAKLSGFAPEGSAGIANEVLRLSRSGEPGGELDTLDAELQSRTSAAHVARDAFDRLKAAALSDEQFRKLSSDAEAARASLAAAKQSLTALTLRIEKLNSEQAGADEEGLASQVDALKGIAERHDLEVRRLEAECKALLLLAKTLAALESQARDAYFEPVTRRVQPYLQEVIGAADLGFKDAFAIDGLTRAGVREDFSVLSDGTREQISVLVRLGFAELLAARGVAVPLVLDDPLVYSDDERLAKVCRVLERASPNLQIIVLTCRATAFQMLSGRRVSVTPWQPDA